MPRKPLISPRLSALEEGPATFWRGVEADGAPLVEPIEDEPGWHLVTFLWRDRDGGTRNVFIVGGPGHWDTRRDLMQQLPGTDIWFKTYRLRSDWRGSYRLSPNDSLEDLDDVEEDEWAQRSAGFRPDPLNPRRLVLPRDPDDPADRDEVRSVAELPGAPVQPWFDSRPGVPSGAVEVHRVRSTTLDNERSVWVYTPPGYAASAQPHGMLLLFDGSMWARTMPIMPTLDNLLAEGRIPPLVAVMVGNAKRDLELPCHPPFVAFLRGELVPWVRERWRVTDDPKRVVAAGQSYGGLAAAFAGLRAPEVVGNVLGQSTSCFWRAGTDFDLEAEWLTREFVRSPTVPIRLYLEAGMMETGHHSIVGGNRRLRDLLRLKGYEVVDHEFCGGHDYLCWRGGLADGLIALTEGWSSPG